MSQISSQTQIAALIQSSIDAKKSLLEGGYLAQIERVLGLWIAAYRKGGKILFCGNGGSAADAQHLAAELSGRFYTDRPPLYAEALHVNTSYLTAVGNDYGYDFVFERMTEAAGRKGDILVALSTSGNSPNVLKAVEKANQIGMTTIGMAGSRGGKLKSLCQECLCVPSDDTPRIQEMHLLIGHILCQMVEKALFEK
jgi:D-sedoheptulose 7-phosphate isomerase